MPDLKPLREAILSGDAKTAKATTEAALAAGLEPMQLVQEYMMPAMAEVGRRFECNEYFVPELLLSARAMKGALELVRPRLAASGIKAAARVVVGTVKGDLHDIGKNLVVAIKIWRTPFRPESSGKTSITDSMWSPLPSHP